MSDGSVESKSAGTVLPPGDLKARAWKRFLRGPDPVLLDELYVPALAEAVRYDRCCAYFSSTVLSAAARGFAKLIERLIARGEDAQRPSVRLIVNEELSAEDVQAMTETGDTAKLEEALLKRFKKPKDVLEKQRLAMLGWLVKAGLLDIRVGVMRRGVGIVHAKFGIITDESGNAVVFNGSGNESAQGLIANYERLEVSTSWSDTDRYDEYRNEFNTLWNDTHPDVHTVTLPAALQLKLIKLAPKEPPVNEPSNALARQKAAMIWQFIVESPYLIGEIGEATCDATAMVDLWPHQRRVVQETTAAWPDGRLLCDEVGMGKTIEAILILRRLLAGRGVRRALLLMPAGLLKQWQAELREKGGLIFPRLEGINTLVWPDERTERVEDLAEALRQDVLLMSRETARTERNLPVLLAAEPWDLVLLDEAHAARRRDQVESEFNSANLLLDLLRQLQLRRRARGILLLSATPMQTHPWEPWDLLSVLGEGGAWLADFSAVRDYYGALAAMSSGQCELPLARRAAALIASDSEFPPLPDGNSVRSLDDGALARKLSFAPVTQREEWSRWLRQSSPLSRRMHRNTRDTLRQYHQMGLLERPPARRSVEDVQFDFEDARERQAYDAVTRYINERFEKLEGEKPGKGFVMTIYRRRASSSPQAIRESLNRRRAGLQAVAERRAYDVELRRDDAPELLGDDDVPEGEKAISAAFPESPDVAKAELAEVERLLADLRALGALDSKRDKFFGLLRQVTDDGRPALVFTEYTDTLDYLRDSLVDHYGQRLGSYSGDGGRVWDGESWKPVTKDAITRKLRQGELSVLLCTDAASEGLNLQAAGALINYDLPWNPSKVEQRIGRIDRIGQQFSPIWIINLFLKDSVDEQVYRVLRTRCQLFEHFVGAMQPVLAKARRVLLSGNHAQIEELAQAASDVERDRLSADTYVQAVAQETPTAKAATTKSDLLKMMQLFDGSFGPECCVAQDERIVELSNAGLPKACFAVTTEQLEADRAVHPLSPSEPTIRQLAAVLGRPGERLPLVIAAGQQSAFRATSACWVRDGEVLPIASLSALLERVDEWDGTYPPPSDWQGALADRKKDAEEEVRRRESAATAREKLSVARQRLAALLRLRRELGRFLVCIAGTADDLNSTFHEQMRRDTAGARRLQRCFAQLGEYPDWTEAERSELSDFVDALTDNQRQARAIGVELEAALVDPRWTG
ncbi:RNA polymerase-associated protein RapA [Phycisphaerae bacterium RAS2]|nr:RNA polymerase-associated protein RapA [Phycisphaerae bacterium RAS2]